MVPPPCHNHTILWSIVPRSASYYPLASQNILCCAHKMKQKTALTPRTTAPTMQRVCQSGCVQGKTVADNCCITVCVEGKSGIFADTHLIMCLNKLTTSGRLTAGGLRGQNSSNIGDDANDNGKKDDANSCNSTLADRWAVLIDLLLAVLCCAAPRSGKDQGTAGLP